MNLFDPQNAPTTEPPQFVVGDFVQWRKLVGADYDPALHTMTYVMRPTNGMPEITIVGTNYASDYLFTISSATSADFTAGTYYWQLEAKRNSDNARIVIERGQLNILVDIDVQAAELRSDNQIILDKINSLLLGRADSDVSNYSVAGRSLTKMTFAELVEARDYFRGEVLRESRAEAAAAGKPTGNTVKVRFIDANP